MESQLRGSDVIRHLASSADLRGLNPPDPKFSLSDACQVSDEGCTVNFEVLQVLQDEASDFSLEDFVLLRYG